MTQVLPTAAPVNPFSTRFIQPGAIPYRFPEGTDAVELVERLRANDWQGQIVGPHGSGKSTLLAALDAPLRDAGRNPLAMALHDGQRRLPINLARRAELGASTVIIVDGYEQLNRLSRWMLGRRCRQRGWGLLITAHESVGMPELFRTETNLETARWVVEQLLATSRTGVRGDDVIRIYDRHDGNVREMLFELYDLVEQRRQWRSGARTT